MRRGKNSVNPWLILSVPVIGVAGWAIHRITGHRKIRGQSALNLPVEENRLISPGRSQDMGQKEAEDAMKTQSNTTRSTAASKGQAPAPALIKEEIGPIPAPTAQTRQAGYAFENQREHLRFFFALLIPFLILPVVIVLLALHHIPVQSQAIVPGGSADRGKAALQAWGCGACHTIEGVPGADGKIGPSLKGLSDRSYIAGHLRNTPDNMIQWIMHPQEVSPGVDMPDSGVPEETARDMAAYLYSIR